MALATARLRAAAQRLSKKMSSEARDDAMDAGRAALEAGAIRFMVDQIVIGAEMTRAIVRGWVMREEGEQIPQQLVQDAALAQLLQASPELLDSWTIVKLQRRRERDDITALGDAVRSYIEGPSEYEIVFEQGGRTQPLLEQESAEAFLARNYSDVVRAERSMGLPGYAGTRWIGVDEAAEPTPAKPPALQPLPRAARGERKIDLDD